nr:TPA_asm: RdRp [Cotesiavirus rhabdovi]
MQKDKAINMEDIQNWFSDPGSAKPTRQSKLLSTHCDVPLKYNKQRAALMKPAPGQHVGKNNFAKLELERINSLRGRSRVDFTDLAHILFDLLNKLAPHAPELLLCEWKQQLRIAQEVGEVEGHVLKDMFPELLGTEPLDLSDRDKTSLFQSYLTRSFWEEGVLSSGSKTFVPRFWWKDAGHGIFHATIGHDHYYVGEEIFVVETPDRCYLTSRDHLLILSDLASERYILELTCRTGQDDSIPNWNLIFPLLVNGDLMLKHGGNAAYDAVYSWEPCITARIIGDVPLGCATGKTFKETMDQAAMEKAEPLGIGPLMSIRFRILDALQYNVSYLSQLHGLHRIWGHPTIEPLEGTSALKNVSTRVRLAYQPYIDAILDKFKEEFLLRYIKSEHIWPKLDCSLLPRGNIIRKAYEAQGEFPFGHMRYDRTHLRLVELYQIFPVDPKFDILEMLADKSLSLNTKDLIRKLVNKEGVGSGIERSVLVQWLESDLHDPKEFLDFINLHGFPEFEISVGVKEKEREGKLKARLFGLMTIVKRTYIVLTEALLAEHVLNYFPEITMIDDEMTLDKKRMMFNNPKFLEHALFTSLDFTKWNSYMRREETNGLFTCFDQMFGFDNVFQRTHEMFEGSFMYLLNGSYLPRWNGSHFVPDIGGWYGHLGGIEGLRQKGWTVWTVVLIILISEDFPVSIALMGQGDNQIIRYVFDAQIDKDEQLAIVYRILDKLNSYLKYVGPPLKLEETWISRSTYIYGKYFIHNGAPLPSSLKRFMRMFKLSNEDYATAESTLSSLTANISSAYASSFDPANYYFIYMSEVVGALQLWFRGQYLQPFPPYVVLSSAKPVQIQRSSYKVNVEVRTAVECKPFQKDVVYKRLWLTPRCIGGLPISSLPQLLIRGFPDEVSLSISHLKSVYRHVSAELQQAIRSILNPPLSPEQSFGLIFEHPTALNLDIPFAPSEARRSAVVDYLTTTPRVKNEHLRAFFSFLKTKEDEKLASFLSLANPFAPRVLSMIMNATLESRAKHMAGRLQKTKTVSRLAVLEGLKNIERMVMNSEINHMRSVLSMSSGSRPGPIPWHPYKCSVTHANDLRNKSWNRVVAGVDCVPPLEFMLIESVKPNHVCPSSSELDKGYISVRLPDPCSHLELKDPMTPGPFRAYRGSQTRQKTSGYGDKLAKMADPIIAPVLRLFSLLDWSFPKDGNIGNVIKALHASRTDLDPSLLIPEEQASRGSWHHRVQDQRTGHGGATAVLPNQGSKIFFNTFPFDAYSKGSKNVNLMFQPLMVIATTLIGWNLRKGVISPTAHYHIHVKSSCCVRDVVEDMIDCPIPYPGSFIEHQESAYLYVPKEKLIPLLNVGVVLPITARFSNVASVCRDRLITSVAEELYLIASPTEWSMTRTSFHLRRLTINWCLRLPLLRTMEALSLRLVNYFCGVGVIGDKTAFLERAAERISRTSSKYWSNMDNLIFCPGVQHEISQKPYSAGISSDPCLSPGAFGGILRDLVRSIVLAWRDPVIFNERREGIPLLASNHTPVNNHPALLELMADWLGGQFTGNVTEVKKNILHRIVSTPIPLVGGFFEGSVEGYVNRASHSVFGENIDLLSKKAPTYVPDFVENDLQRPDLPSAAFELVKFTRADLVKHASKVAPEVKIRRTDYTGSVARPVQRPSGGNYKGLSLMRHLNEHVDYGVAVLGDGGGGYSWSVLRYHLEATVFYNTLVNTNELIEQAPPIPYVPALAGWPSLESRLIDLTLTNEGISDILHPQFSTFLRTRLHDRVQAVICDAEHPHYYVPEKCLELTASLIDVSDKFKVRWLIMKTYALSPSVLEATICLLLGTFSEVQVVRSDFSTSGNTEVFLYCRMYDPTPLIHRIGGDSVSHSLKAACKKILNDMAEVLQGRHTLPDRDVLLKYTDTLGEDIDEYARTFLDRFATFWTHDKVLTYPHDILTWIIYSSSRKAGKADAHKNPLITKHFSGPMRRRWVIVWLAMWRNFSTNDTTSLENIVQDGCLIWYVLKDGTWEVSLSSEIPPEEEQGRWCRVWDLKTLLNVSHVKVIYRLSYLLNLINPTVRKLSQRLERGGLSWYGKPIHPQKMAVNQWVKTHIQSEGKGQADEVDASRKPRRVRTIWEQKNHRKRDFLR